MVQQQQVDGVAVGQAPLRRSNKHSSEVLKILQTMDRTPTSNWSALSGSLTHLLKCVETNVESVAGDAAPDITLLCRVIYKCLEPKGVMGVHRKALEVLEQLAERLGAVRLLQQMPLLLAAVLNLLPRCSLQVKCELLNFVDKHMLRGLPAEVIALQLPGIVPALLGGLEEGGESEVYRLSLKLMEYIHSIFKAYTPGGAAPNSESEEGLEDSSAIGENQSEGVLYCRDAAVYRALWFTLKNSPSLRAATLLYLKQRFDGAMNRGSSETRGGEITADTRTFWQGTNSASHAATPASVFLGNDIRLVHSSIFVTLQDQSERTRRLMLDLLIIAFPLSDATLFTSAEKSLLVSAVVQQLGISDGHASTQRRVLEWLTGPSPDIAPQFIQEVSSFHVAQAFHQFTSWWKLYFVGPPTQQQSQSATGSSALERSYYYGLHVSACTSAATRTAEGGREENSEPSSPYILPTVWLKALVTLFKAAVEGGTPDSDDVVSCGSGAVSPCDQSCNEYDDVRWRLGGTPFREHLVPLIMPYACDLLVSMELLMSRGLARVDSVEAAVDAFFASVSWDYFVSYKRGIVALLESTSDRIIGGSTPHPSASALCAASESGCATTPGASRCLSPYSQSLSQTENRQGPVRCSRADQNLLDNLQLRFLQLRGMTKLLEKYATVSIQKSAKQTAAFRLEILSICQSLSGIIRCVSASALNRATAPETLGTSGVTSSMEAALFLVEGCFQEFSLLFNNIILTLWSDLDSIGNEIPDGGSESKLLTLVTESAGILTKLVAFHATEWRALLGRFNCGVLTLLCRVFSLGCGKLEVCGNALNEWLQSLVSATAGSPSLAVQKDCLRLFVNISKPSESTFLSGEDLRGGSVLKTQLIPRMWHLLGICSEGMQPEVVELLLQLYVDDEARPILDEVTTEETTECGERLAILFFWMSEREAPQNLFLPGLYMLLRALASKNAALRWIAQSAVRQFIPCLHRLVNPLLISLTRQLVCFNPAGDGCDRVEKKPDNLPAYSTQELHDYEAKQLNPSEFVHIVGCLLTNPATSPQLLIKMCNTPPPVYMASRLPLLSLPVYSDRCDLTENDDDEANGDSTGVDSTFAALVQVLLGIAYQNLSPRFIETTPDGVWQGGELGVAAVETLSMVLQACRSLLPLPRSVKSTWEVASIRVLELLHEVVRCRLFPPEQVAMLQHLLDIARLIGGANTARTTSSTEGGGDESRRCINVLKMDLFYETVEVGVERAAARALLPHGRSDRDILGVWCDTLLSLVPFLHGRRDEGCSRILQIFTRVVQQQVRTDSSLKDFTAMRVMEVCLNGIFGVLEYCLERENAMASSQASVATKTMQSNSRWFSSRVLFSMASPHVGRKATGCAVECAGVIRESMRQIVATLYKAYRCIKRHQKAGPELNSQQSSQDITAEPVVGKRVVGSVACTAAEAGAAQVVEAAIYRVLLLCREAVPTDFFRIFVEVWAEKYVPELNDLLKKSMAAHMCHNDTVPCSDTPSAGIADDLEGASPSTMMSIITMDGNLCAQPSDLESVGHLLSIGTSTIAVTLMDTVREILADTTTASLVVVPQCEVFGTGLTFDGALLYLVHAFMRASPPSAEDTPKVLAAMISCFSHRLAVGAVSVPTLAFMLLCLSHFLPRQGTSEGCGEGVDALSVWGKEKHCSSVLCKILDSLSSTSSIASETASVDPEALYFALNVVSHVLPQAVRGLHADHDRVTTATISMCRRSVFPVIAFGIDAQIDEDAHARTPLVRAALGVTLAAADINDIIPRRLRQELLDGPCSWDFFRLPRLSLREYGRLFARLSGDRAFHADIIQLLMPPLTQPNRFAGLVNQPTSEEQHQLQRAVLMRRLTFYVLSMPSMTLMADRGLCLKLREQLADAFRSTATPASGRRTHGNAKVYEAIFLFRVLLVKLDPALLQPFWPLVLPEVVRILTQPSIHTEATAGPRETKVCGTYEAQEDVSALQLECLKVLHFAVVIMPEVVASFRWVFIDDLEVMPCRTATDDAAQAFVPIVRRLVTNEVSPASAIRELEEQTPTSGSGSPAWGGYQRPLLNIPSILNGGSRGVQMCAAALLLPSLMRDLTALTVSTAEQQRLLTYTRLLDGWDESYMKHMLEMDFSCVHEAGGLL